MDRFHFLLTVFFMLLGPIKIIPAFALATRGRDLAFKRKVAFQATLIASAICLFLLLSTDSMIGRYHIKLESLKISGGLVLLLSALGTIFPRPQKEEPIEADAAPLRVALSPIATPLIVTPAGVAAIMIFVKTAPTHPGMYLAIGLALATVMVLDFLVMHFHDLILKIPGFMPILKVFGSVLIVVQVAGAIDLIVESLAALGLFSR